MKLGLGLRLRSKRFILQGLRAEEQLKNERLKGNFNFEDIKDSIYRDIIGELKSQPLEDAEIEAEEEIEEEVEVEVEVEEGDEAEVAPSKPVVVNEPPQLPRQAQIQPAKPQVRPNQLAVEEDITFEGSEHFSMDANTAGTESTKVHYLLPLHKPIRLFRIESELILLFLSFPLVLG